MRHFLWMPYSQCVSICLFHKLPLRIYTALNILRRETVCITIRSVCIIVEFIICDQIQNKKKLNSVNDISNYFTMNRSRRLYLRYLLLNLSKILLC